jgi:hypothetical protein
MRFSSYQICHIMQVYKDKLCSGEDKKELFCGGKLPSGKDKPLSESESHLIAERIIRDIRERINDTCAGGIEQKISGIEPGPETDKDKYKPANENNFIYKTIGESGKIISREITLNYSEFLIKKT